MAKKTTLNSSDLRSKDEKVKKLTVELPKELYKEIRIKAIRKDQNVQDLACDCLRKIENKAICYAKVEGIVALCHGEEHQRFSVEIPYDLHTSIKVKAVETGITMKSLVTSIFHEEIGINGNLI